MTKLVGGKSVSGRDVGGCLPYPPSENWPLTAVPGQSRQYLGVSQRTRRSGSPSEVAPLLNRRSNPIQDLLRRDGTSQIELYYREVELSNVGVEEIRDLARAAHAGQTDKLGRDYFEAHLAPIAAGLRAFGPAAEAAGWLHDVIEDTHHTADSLRSADVPEEIVVAVESVTKADGEPYGRLIERACADPLGRLVKLVDNTWNLVCAPRLSQSQPGVAEDLARRKYRPARAELLAALGWDEEGPELQRIEPLLAGLQQDLVMRHE